MTQKRPSLSLRQNSGIVTLFEVVGLHMRSFWPMILNSESVELIRSNALRLSQVIKNKEDLVDLATASSFEQVFSAIETILTNTDMFFDDALLSQLNLNNWPSFKAILLVYTLNIVNRSLNLAKENPYATSSGREFGASLSTL